MIKRKGLTGKLFFLNMLSIIGLLVFMGLLQNFIFTTYYRESKIRNLENTFEKFTTNFQENKWNSYELYKEKEKYEKKNNAVISIIPADVEFIGTEFQQGMEVVIVDQDGKERKIPLDGYIVSFIDGDLPKEGDTLEATAIMDDAKTILSIEKLDLNGKTVYDVQDAALIGDIEFSFGDDYVAVTPEGGDTAIASDNIDGSASVPSVKITGTAKSVSQGWYSNENITTQLDPYSNVEYITMQKTIKFDNINNIVYLEASLQPVSELGMVIAEYFWIFIVVGILVAIFLTYFVSRRFTKPIKEITRVANDMAHLNFDTRSKVSTEDELGVLSNALNTMSTKLHHSLEELTIANESLEQDIERRIEDERTRKELISNVSHDLKTPLAVIRSHAEALKDGIKVEKTPYYLEVILDEAEQMNTLLMDMIKLSKIEYASYQLNITELNIKDLLLDVWHVYAQIAEEKNVCLNVIGGGFVFKGDEQAMVQVLNNLLSNVVDYAKRDSVITVTMMPQRLEICNEGPRIPEGDLERIWQRFYRVDKSRNRQLGGTGIGLAIVKTLVGQQGFGCGVENTADGVKFSIDFNKN